MQISGKRLHHYLCTACRHEELLFCSQPGTANDIPLPPGSLLGGRQDHVLFRLCEMQLEAPPQPAGASVKRSEGKKKRPPCCPAVCWLWSPGPSFVPPRGPLIRTFALSFGEEKPWHSWWGCPCVCREAKSLSEISTDPSTLFLCLSQTTVWTKKEEENSRMC